MNGFLLAHSLPLIVAVSLVYSATRHEQAGPILVNAARIALWIVGVMAVLFAGTTMDAGVRLQRYIVQEWGNIYKIPPLQNGYVATFVAVGACLALAFGAGGVEGKGGIQNVRYRSTLDLNGVLLWEALQSGLRAKLVEMCATYGIAVAED